MYLTLNKHICKPLYILLPIVLAITMLILEDIGIQHIIVLTTFLTLKNAYFHGKSEKMFLRTGEPAALPWPLMCPHWGQNGGGRSPCPPSYEPNSKEYLIADTANTINVVISLFISVIFQTK